MGTTTSKGTVKVDTPLGALTFHVVEADTPFLLLLYDLDKIGVYYNNLTNQLVLTDQLVSEVVVIHPYFIKIIE